MELVHAHSFGLDEWNCVDNYRLRSLRWLDILGLALLSREECVCMLLSDWT